MSEAGEKRWTIYVCKRCGYRWDRPKPPDADFGCRADGLDSPPHEIEPIEVIPAAREREAWEAGYEAGYAEAGRW